MRTYSVLVALCLYLVAAHASSVYMWSNTKYFNGKNIEVSEKMSSDALKSALSGEGPLAKYLGGHKIPEAIVVFVEPERAQKNPTLGVSSFSQLQTSLGSSLSASSMLLHEVSSQASGSGLIMSLIQNLPAGATVTVARNSGSNLLSNLNGRPDVRFITLTELKERKDSKVADLVVVVLDEPAEDAVGSILRTIPGNYLAMHTTVKPESEKVLSGPAKLVQGVQEINDGTSWDSETIEAVIVMIPFVAILLIGICCTFSVQSGLKFDGEKKKR